MKYIDIFELSRAKTEEKGHLTIDDLPDLKEMLKSETPKADIHWKATGTGQRRRLACALLTIDAKLRAGSTHWLRHTFATNALKTMDINLVQNAMGHASIGTTSRYLTPEESQIAQAMKKLPAL